MKVSEFAQQYPMYKIDFEAHVRDQARVYDGARLDQFPVELEPDFPYHAGSRGRPNLNQTLTHSQCATCQRVLRNDLFYTVPSMMKRNMVFSHCRECNQQHNADRYDARAEQVQARRVAIWHFLASACSICGFDKHLSAMDLHHPNNKEPQIAELITVVAFTLQTGQVETLLREASKCTPLCSNCHRLVHAGVINAPTATSAPRYRLADLLIELKSIE